MPLFSCFCLNLYSFRWQFLVCVWAVASTFKGRNCVLKWNRSHILCIVPDVEPFTLLTNVRFCGNILSHNSLARVSLENENAQMRTQILENNDDTENIVSILFHIIFSVLLNASALRASCTYSNQWHWLENVFYNRTQPCNHVSHCKCHRTHTHTENGFSF